MGSGITKPHLGSSDVGPTFTISCSSRFLSFESRQHGRSDPSRLDRDPDAQKRDELLLEVLCLCVGARLALRRLGLQVSHNRSSGVGFTNITTPAPATFSLLVRLA